MVSHSIKLSTARAFVSLIFDECDVSVQQPAAHSVTRFSTAGESDWRFRFLFPIYFPFDSIFNRHNIFFFIYISLK
jgi:hypothetical protein